jgi:hypothetical protein
MTEQQSEGGRMARSRQSILSDIEAIQDDMGCTPGQAMIIFLVELIENDPRAEMAEMYIRAENSGKKQSAAVLDSLLKEREKRQKGK